MIELKKKTRPVSKELQQKSAQALETLRAREDLGFFRVADRDSIWQKADQHGRFLHENYDRIVVVGIGGSFLGPKTLTEALPHSEKKVTYLSNVDGEHLSRVLSQIGRDERVRWVLISKSGGTRETLTLADAIHQWCEEQGRGFVKDATVISEPVENLLTSWAVENEVPCFELSEDIGGRFSVFTSVGLIPARFAGHDLEKYRSGLRWSLENRDLVSELVAQSLSSFENEEWLTNFWIYSSILGCTGGWIQQLWAESLGKKVDRDGGPAPQASTPLPLVGSEDQHSVLQQVSEGAEKKFNWFVLVRSAQSFGPEVKEGFFTKRTGMVGKPVGALLAAFAQSTCKALEQDGHASVVLELESVSEESIAALMMTTMLVVGALGEAMNINAFDQPGVELGKRLVSEFL